MSASRPLFPPGGPKPATGWRAPRPAPPPLPAPRAEGNGGGAEPGSADRPYSVVELSRLIRKTLEDGFGHPVWLEGEISAIGGRDHLFLTFRQDGAVLAAIIWGSDARRLDFRPAQGDRVRARGRISAYAGDSKYQFHIKNLQPVGRGALLLELREREERLRAEGLFDDARKKPLPYLPLRIGLLTAAGSNAYNDFVQTAHRRFPGLRIVVRAATVQGVRAPDELRAGIRALDRRGLDLIVVTRGGGSFEQLLPFSEEAVVRAAAACSTPLVSAVGHEDDRPLLDFAADYRAKTPTAAAEEVIRNRGELRQELASRERDARLSARAALGAAAQRLAALAEHRGRTALPHHLRRQADALRLLGNRAKSAFRAAADARRERAERLRASAATGHPARQLAARSDALAALRRRLAATAPFAARERRLLGAAARLSPEPLRERVAAAREDCRRRLARAGRAVGNRLASAAARAAGRGEALAALDPTAVLRRGYSVTLDRDGRALRSAEEVRPGEPVRITLARGALGARVEEVILNRAPGEPNRSAGETP